MKRGYGREQYRLGEVICPMAQPLTTEIRNYAMRDEVHGRTGEQGSIVAERNL